MDARRIRIMLVPIMAVGILASLSAIPTAAVNACSLSAPVAVKVGDPLAVLGSGFPASTSVAVSFTLDGGTPDEFSVTSNGAGSFQIKLTAEEADTGRTTVVAKAGTKCTATVAFTVVGANATLPPEASPSTQPHGSGVGTTSGGGTAPRTDAVSTSGAPTNGQFTAWIIAVLSLAIGVGGLIATRLARSR